MSDPGFEPVIGVSIRAGESAERQRIVEFLEALPPPFPAAAAEIRLGKKLDPARFARLQG